MAIKVRAKEQLIKIGKCQFKFIFAPITIYK